MDIEKIKTDLKSAFMFRKTDSGCLINNSFVCYNLDNEDMPVAFVEKGEEIILTDMGLTYKRLLAVDIELDDEQLAEYLARVFSTFGVKMNEKKEIFMKIVDEKKAVLAMSRFLQSLILLNNIDLQFNEE
ncbi:MAG: DUF1828 domain-containing protein [Clostridia bacterium]|nr:DUF1828 domain-containing protein [Clostridia bacterium]